MKKSIWIGFDPREQDALQVCVSSIRAHLSEDIPIQAVALQPLMECGMYDRPTKRENGQLFDVISDAPMSTEFAISRFFIPHITGDDDVSLFMDCDMLVRCDLTEVFGRFDETKAIQVVKHNHEGDEGTKMDGQKQTAYSRKNWSSVMLWNLTHPANKLLTIAKLNSWAGRALHQFQWLEDEEIGELPPDYNHLVGVQPENPSARIVHFTLGIPSMAGYENCEFADQWRAEQETALSS